jgi:hypothetical protein
MATSSEIRYTAASSEVSTPTRRFESRLKPNPFSASDRSAGPILAAQPQVRARPVSVFFLKSSIPVSPENKKISSSGWCQYLYSTSRSD